jgi:hypothetical protein
MGFSNAVCICTVQNVIFSLSQIEITDFSKENKRTEASHVYKRKQLCKIFTLE